MCCANAAKDASGPVIITSLFLVRLLSFSLSSPFPFLPSLSYLNHRSIHIRFFDLIVAVFLYSSRLFQLLGCHSFFENFPLLYHSFLPSSFGRSPSLPSPARNQPITTSSVGPAHPTRRDDVTREAADERQTARTTRGPKRQSKGHPARSHMSTVSLAAPGGRCFQAQQTGARFCSLASRNGHKVHSASRRVGVCSSFAGDHAPCTQKKKERGRPTMFSFPSLSILSSVASRRPAVSRLVFSASHRDGSIATDSNQNSIALIATHHLPPPCSRHSTSPSWPLWSLSSPPPRPSPRAPPPPPSP